MWLKVINLEYQVGHRNILSPLCSLVVLYGEVDHNGNRMGARPLSMVYTLMMMLLFYCSTIKNSILLVGLWGS